MAEVTLRKYDPVTDREVWDAFIRASRNGTFLFERGYMDYHADRFKDHSLMAYKNGKLAALLPADIVAAGDRKVVLRSHGGLTYGGWVLPPRHVTASDVMEIFSHLSEYCMANGISALDYKPVPYIYHRMPSQDDLYALFRLGAELTERNISCTIDLQENPGLNTQQKRNLKRGEGKDHTVRELENVEGFHVLLTECLASRHDVTPVHSVEELQLLRDRFPGRIRAFVLEVNGEAHAGVLVFDTGMVAHAQYICSSEFGRREGLLTVLFNRLFVIFSHCRYFDFGISNEDRGLYLNEGLYRQKASLGGSGTVYDRYRIDFSANGKN